MYIESNRLVVSTERSSRLSNVPCGLCASPVMCSVLVLQLEILVPEDLGEHLAREFDPAHPVRVARRLPLVHSHIGEQEAADHIAEVHLLAAEERAAAFAQVLDARVGFDVGEQGPEHGLAPVGGGGTRPDALALVLHLEGLVGLTVAACERPVEHIAPATVARSSFEDRRRSRSYRSGSCARSRAVWVVYSTVRAALVARSTVARCRRAYRCGHTTHGCARPPTVSLDGCGASVGSGAREADSVDARRS